MDEKLFYIFFFFYTKIKINLNMKDFLCVNKVLSSFYKPAHKMNSFLHIWPKELIPKGKKEKSP